MKHSIHPDTGSGMRFALILSGCFSVLLCALQVILGDIHSFLVNISGNAWLTEMLFSVLVFSIVFILFRNRQFRSGLWAPGSLPWWMAGWMLILALLFLFGQ